MTFLTIVSVPFIMLLLWELKNPKKLNVFVLNKSVLFENTKEHVCFFWVLNNEKFYKTINKKYNLNKDYFGFFPDGNGGYKIDDLENYSEFQVDSLSECYDAVYFADTYGIYSRDWRTKYISKNENSRKISDSSWLIYGGLSENDFNLLKLMKKKKKLIFSEFNIIALPTLQNVRGKFEEEFNIYWTGWVGRYFDSFDTVINRDLPKWLIDNYLDNNNNQWPFKNSGIVLVNENGKIIILENFTHLLSELPIIKTSEIIAEKFNVVEEIKYPFWFDIIKVEAPNNIISNYHINTNSIGDSLLKIYNVPNVFPAVVQYTDDYLFYYMAGDFSDCPLTMQSSYFKYVQVFSFLFYSSATIERKSFFWEYYRPFMKTVLNEYYYKKIK